MLKIIKKMIKIVRHRFSFFLLGLIILSLFLALNMTFTSKHDLVNSSWTTTTQVIPLNHVSLTTGYICIFISTILWGCYLMPVKHYDTGDGVFFQFIMCISIWFTGVFVDCIKDFPKFYGLTVIGGVGIVFGFD